MAKNDRRLKVKDDRPVSMNDLGRTVGVRLKRDLAEALDAFREIHGEGDSSSIRTIMRDRFRQDGLLKPPKSIVEQELGHLFSTKPSEDPDGDSK